MLAITRMPCMKATRRYPIPPHYSSLFSPEICCDQLFVMFSAGYLTWRESLERIYNVDLALAISRKRKMLNILTSETIHI